MPSPRKSEPNSLYWRIVDFSEDSVRFRDTDFPARFVALLTHPQWRSSVLLDVLVDGERGPVAVGLGRPKGKDHGELLTYIECHEQIRSTIDMKSLLRHTAADAVFMRTAERLLSAEDRGGASANEIGNRAASLRDTAYRDAEPRRRRLLTSSHLDEVAAAYRSALDAGHAPTQAVAEQFNVAHSTAAKWVRKARDVGALGAARGSRPGEVEQP